MFCFILWLQAIWPVTEQDIERGYKNVSVAMTARYNGGVVSESANTTIYLNQWRSLTVNISLADTQSAWVAKEGEAAEEATLEG